MTRTTLVTLALTAAAAVVAPTAAVADHPSVRAPAIQTKKAKKRCDPNYRGACLKPNVSDYDCAGGSGDGPFYVRGPFRVVGTDHYRLDANHDGIACER